jgi:glycosyltransferase involved in cell wall biosynthesis
MKILIASILPVNKISSWSGICTHVYQQLKKNHDVTYCFSKEAYAYQQKLAKLSYWSFKIFGKRRNVYFSSRVAKLYQRELSKQLKNQNPDIILVLGSGTEIAFLNTDISCYLLADANFTLLKNWYAKYSNLAAKDVNEALNLEKKCYKKFNRIYFTSAWALNATKDQYPALRSKLRETNFGSNIPEPTEFNSRTIPDATTDLNLLSVGKDEVRKGLDSSRKLSARLSANLTVIGSDIKLDKSKESDLQQLISEYKKAHFLLLFSIADCTPIVINEANSMAVPVISFDVGGIASQIKQGVNGFIVKDLDGAESVIIQYLGHEEKYAQLCKSSYEHYKENLSWSKFEKDLLSK